MKVLITGASGFIGSYISWYLHEQNRYELTLMVRKTPEYLKRLGGDIRIIECDVLDAERIEETVQDNFDIIIHLAAFNDVDTNKDPEKALLVNAFGTRNILKRAVALGVKHVIYFSVLQVYGRELNGHYTYQSQVLCDNDYSLNHYMAEEYCRMFTANHGLTTSIIRQAYAFGCPVGVDVDRWTLVPEAFCRSAVFEKKILLKSSGRSSRDFVPLSYVARSVEQLIINPAEGFNVYNMTTGTVMSIIDTAVLVRDLAEEVLNEKIELIVESNEPTEANYFCVENNLLGSLGKNEILEEMRAEMKKIILMLKDTQHA